jgi:hypothetical protein
MKYFSDNKKFSFFLFFKLEKYKHFLLYKTAKTTWYCTIFHLSPKYKGSNLNLQKKNNKLRPSISTIPFKLKNINKNKTR